MCPLILFTGIRVPHNQQVPASTKSLQTKRDPYTSAGRVNIEPNILIQELQPDTPKATQMCSVDLLKVGIFNIF